MKRRSSKLNMTYFVICILIFIVILMGIYIITNKRQTNQKNKTTQTQNEENQSTFLQPGIISTTYVDNYDYYDFLPRRLFRNFYDDYYYRERPQYIVQQDTKPIYINVPQQSTPTITQPAQQNNLNLYNYPEPKPNVNTSTIEPPPLSGVSSSTPQEIIV